MLKRAIILVFALLMYSGLRHVGLEDMGGGADPLTLAAVGLVVMAAYTVGETVTAFSVPRVTGYILTGVLLGPQVSNVLSPSVVEDMSVFNTLALGLIATTAGLELDLRAILRVWKTLAAVVAAKLPLLMVGVGGTFMAMQALWPLLEVPNQAANWALALILSVLGIGTSPAIVLAVVNESRARGRLTDLVMAMAVVKDVVVVLCLALAVALAHTLLTPGAVMDVTVLKDVLTELGASLGAGSLLGLLFVAWLRFVRRDMLVFVSGTILIASELSKLLHLELLLVFIAAGFTVKNLSENEHSLLESLERIALPVFVVFFTTAGAGIDLRGSLAIFPLALGLAVGRAGAYIAANRIGAYLGGEPPEVRNNGWLTWLPQAGVTLGLVLLTAENLPELAEPVRALGLALVALHLLVGPILLSVGLKRGGEVGGSEVIDASAAEASSRALPADDALAQTCPGETDRHPVDPARSPSAIAASLRDPPLAEALSSMGEALEREAERFRNERIRPMAERTRRVLLHLIEDADDEEQALDAVVKVYRSAPPDLSETWVDDITDFLDAAFRIVQGVDEKVRVPLHLEALRPRPGDSRILRIRKGLRRVLIAVGSRRWACREVPLRLFARAAIEARLAEFGADMSAGWFRRHASMLDHIRRVLEGTLSLADARISIDEAARDWIERARVDLEEVMARSLRALAHGLEHFDLPGDKSELPALSMVQDRVEAARRRLRGEAPLWRRAVSAAHERVRADALVHRIAADLDRLAVERLHNPLDLSENEVLPVIDETARHLENLRDDAAAHADVERLDALLRRLNRIYTRRYRVRIRRARASFRRLTDAVQLRGALARIGADMPDEIRIVVATVPLQALRSPEALSFRTLHLKSDIERLLQEDLVPRLGRVLEATAEMVAGMDSRLIEIIAAARYGAEFALRERGGDPELREEVLRSALERAMVRAQSLRSALVDALEAAKAGITREIQEIDEALFRLIDSAPAASAGVVSRGLAQRDTFRKIRAAYGESIRRRVESFERWSQERGLHGGRLRTLFTHDFESTLDATDMRRRLEACFPPPAKLDLPAIYTQKLFSPAPVEDPRLFTAYRSERERIEAVLNDRRAEGLQNIAIIGARGSGRTSLINALRIHTTGRRVIRIDRTFHPRDEGLLDALATELGCDAHPGIITAALREAGFIVILDGLEQLTTLSDQGIRDIDRIVDIMSETRETARWLIAVTPEVMTLLSGLSTRGPLELLFAHRIHLEALNHRTIRHVVETRQKLAGFSLRYPRGRGLSRLFGRHRGSDVERYFRALATCSRGRIGAALQIHLRSMRIPSARENGWIRPCSRPAIGFLRRLPTASLALLALLARWGAMRETEVAAVFGEPLPDVRRRIDHLDASGLLDRNDTEERIDLPAHLLHAVEMELEELGIIARVS